jgi:tetratricopeptide (TPR) repeat protein
MPRLALLRMSGSRCLMAVVLWAVTTVHPAGGADLAECRALVQRGDYEAALLEATEALMRESYLDGWFVLKGELELMLGRWEEAQQTVEQGLKRHNWSLPLRRLAREAYRRTNDDESADRMHGEILRLAESAPWKFTDANNLVSLGEVAIEMGVDPKDVLEAFFERARQASPGLKTPLLAIGRLALDKQDFELAANTFRAAVKEHPEDPDFHWGLAAAVGESDGDAAQEALDRALQVNRRHVPSLLLVAERQIDGEQYAAATKTLEQILDVNAQHDQAHAYLAVIAHLQNDAAGEHSHRKQALTSWQRNPLVDHLIGKKLSQKYRFREGLESQWKSLELDPSYLPARRQAAQDLLRLGVEDEGWKMAAGVYADDQYDVTAYNLVTLRDEMSRFATLEAEPFIVRMEANEARIYGDRVLELLQRARQTLCEKYGLTLHGQVTVEIFPDPADFEVRTFGMPGIPGFLGVCFGSVITANSPASQTAGPSSWEAVLWHEFCHVVTLQLTRNRMPRWLSEGISVYEERQEDPRWGQAMTPASRELILSGKLTPVGQLSSAFMNPDAPGGMSFAYFESALVVEFLIQRFGLDALKDVLSDLGQGLPIEEALPRHTEEMSALETAFAEFARTQAEGLAPEVDWSEPQASAGLLAPLAIQAPREALERWLDAHPTSYRGWVTLADLLTEQSDWPAARDALVRAVQLYPDDVGDDAPARRLAAMHRRLGDVSEERRVLEAYAALDPAADDVFLRLIELGRADGDWEVVAVNARRLLGVNPLVAQPHAALAETAARVNDHRTVIAACRSLLALSPDDPAAIHHRLAVHLTVQGERKLARRHVLQALESAPRFRDAQRLLLELIRTDGVSGGSDVPAPAAPPRSPEDSPGIR